MSPDLDATYLRNLSTGDGEGYLNDEKVVRRLAAIAARLEALEKIVKKARAYAFPNGGRGVRHNDGGAMILCDPSGDFRYERVHAKDRQRMVLRRVVGLYADNRAESWVLSCGHHRRRYRGESESRTRLVACRKCKPKKAPDADHR